MGRRRKNYFLLKSTYFCENLWGIQFSTTPVRSCCFCNKFGTLVWNSTLKKALTFSCSIKGFEIYLWCWTSFPTWWVSSLFHRQHVHRKFKETLATCVPHIARVCIILSWIYGRSNKLETRQILLALFCLNKIFLVSAHDQNLCS